MTRGKQSRLRKKRRRRRRREAEGNDDPKGATMCVCARVAVDDKIIGVFASKGLAPSLFLGFRVYAHFILSLHKKISLFGHKIWTQTMDAFSVPVLGARPRLPREKSDDFDDGFVVVCTNRLL